MRVKIPSVNQIVPGALVSHRYRPELGVIISANWRSVEVLLGEGALVKWAFESFRSCYEVVG